MTMYQRIPAAAVACLALGLGTTACSSAAAPTPPVKVAGADAKTASAAPAGSADPLAGMPLTAIVAKAKANMLALTSMHFVTHFTDPAQPSWDIHEIPGRGCAGTLTAGVGHGSVDLVVDGNKAWIKLEGEALKELGANAERARGKYLAVSSATSGKFASVIAACDMGKSVFAQMNDAQGLTRGAVVTVDGTPALQLKGDGGITVLVSDSAKPYLLSLTSPGADGGTVSFSEFDKPVDLTPPPAAAVVTAPGA
ncbi:hypothetical protein [Streptacidiphilus rugosus]|uniref:hypothetical protein n=1 Tax=Streptacidiphilus rugosus TaxID=405783 RepID=UPI00055ACB21|nr:hypothetical protein [Streptacidiphilus rugosus]